ncbi:protein kinase C delta type-like [Pseudophryne corroboree]|uniref:protein kinase C delta type-like n=1 Tax=Pseudophryne corroboree TaxID=495146 RepID=UPI003081C90C
MEFTVSVTSDPENIRKKIKCICPKSIRVQLNKIDILQNPMDTQHENLKRPLIIDGEAEDEKGKKKTKYASSEKGDNTTTAMKRTSFLLKQFKIHKVLGKGSFGKVVLASMPHKKLVAIKIIKNRHNASSLLRERRVLLEAQGCPYLSHPYAALQSKAHAYFIMEYICGGSIKALMKTWKHLETDKVRFYAAELICGLQFLHSRGIIHRLVQ